MAVPQEMAYFGLAPCPSSEGPMTLTTDFSDGVPLRTASTSCQISKPGASPARGKGLGHPYLHLGFPVSAGGTVMSSAGMMMGFPT